MSDRRWETLWELFHEAADLPRHDRPAFLERACGQDAGLRAEIEELLTEHGSAGFLDSDPPAAELADALDPERLIGTRVGAYTIAGVIGEGGMGTVYAADQQEPVRRRVALKIIKLGMDTREVVARFESERQALALMSHPGIAAVLECGATGEGRPFFAMELVDGVPITLFCDRRRLSLRRRLEIFATLCDAVQHAHRKGIIHRDLKPSNVLVLEEEGATIPKVIDFGIAKATREPLTERTLQTGFGRAVGTPEYMSPEQASGDPDVDTQSDVYSLGVLLYELLCGALPFEHRGKNDEEIRRQTRDTDPQPLGRRFGALGAERERLARARSTDPAALGRELRGELDWIVSRALQRDRPLRYGTAADLAADIRRFLADEPVAAGPPSSAYRIRKLVRRHRTAVVGAAAVVLTLVAGVVATSRMAMVAAAGREAALTAQADAEASRDQARLEAETSQAINDLLLGMLGAPDPEGGAWSPEEARNVRVVDVLARAAQESATTFAGRPHLQAAVRRVIGTTLVRLGLDAEAEEQLRIAAELSAAALGANDPATLTARDNLAAAIDGQGRRAEAIDLYRSNLAARRAVLGDDAADTLVSMANLANALVQQGEIDEARQLFEELQRRGRREEVPADPNFLQALTGLAYILNRQGDAAGAAELYEEVLASHREELGDDHPATLSAIGNLAVARQRNGQLDDAAALYAEVIDGYARVLGPESAERLNAMSNLGSLRRVQGDLQGAAELFRGVAAANADTLGADHPQTLISVNNLARTLTDLGSYEEAAAIYEELMPRARRAYPADHVNLALFRGGYGLLLTKTGRFAEAEPELQAAYRTLSGAIGAAHPQTVSQARRLIELYEAWGRPDEAAKYRALLPSGSD